MDSTYLKQLEQSGSTRYVDRNGVVKDPPNGVFVLDSSGGVIASSPSTTRPLLLGRPSRKDASVEDLLRLKDCIERDSDVSYDKQLKQAIVLVERSSPHICSMAHELTALRWCWNVLLWRPSPDGNRVIKHHPMNPYSK